MMPSASPLRCFHPSNLLTYASLLASIAAIACAGQDSRGLAGALIALAVILDTFDGRFAGRFARGEDQRAIGGQLDSLADAVAFGLAPAMCMLMLRWKPASAGLSTASAGLELLWWMSVFVFVACSISRLAYYNVSHEQTDGFIGLPAPVAALVWATVLLLNPGVTASILVFTATAVAMVMPLPLPRPRGAALAAFVAWPLLVIATHLSTLAPALGRP
jgi:CDP-diacylglycerol---serine O-phosphatidyltransferase